MSDEWFEGDASTDTARRFVGALREYARSHHWYELGITPADTALYPTDDLTQAAVNLVDRTTGGSYGIGTLRIEYAGQVLKGNWSDAQLVHEIELTDPEVLWLEDIPSAELAAAHAGDWLDTQLRRPIVRRDWQFGGSKGRSLWVLADTDRHLVGVGTDLPFSDARGRWHQQNPPPTRPPDRLVIVRPDARHN